MGPKSSKKPKLNANTPIPTHSTELIANAETIFKKYDKDGNGYLSKDEMSLLIHVLFIGQPLKYGLPECSQLTSLIFDLCSLQKNPLGISLPEFKFFCS